MDSLISLSQSAKGHFPNFKMKVMEMKKNLKRWRGFELGMRGVGFVEWNSRPHRPLSIKASRCPLWATTRSRAKPSLFWEFTSAKYR